MNLDQLNHRDLMALLKIFRFDAGFRNLCMRIFFSKLKADPRNEVPLQDLIAMSQLALTQREFRKDFI